MIIRVGIDRASLEAAAKQLDDLASEIKRKGPLICQKLAEIGEARAAMDYAGVHLDGVRDVYVTTEPSDDGYKVVAGGESVLFLEFGAGIRMGYGHPDPHGYGPGTYPGKGHWDSPIGWWIPKDRGGGHTYGNPPAMGMYNASREIRDNAQRVVNEVLLS